MKNRSESLTLHHHNLVPAPALVYGRGASSITRRIPARELMHTCPVLPSAALSSEAAPLSTLAAYHESFPAGLSPCA
jgi:hypothetical protein